MAEAIISVEPKSSLVDQKIDIGVFKLKENHCVTLVARLSGDKGEIFESFAHYIANQDGEVDVGRDLSFGGSYNGVEPMGLLWSMKPAAGQKKGLRLLKRDVTRPYNVTVNCFNGHVTPLDPSPKLLASVTIERWYITDGVERIVVKGQRFRGTMFIPPGDGPFPGVIDLLGGAAVAREFKASLLACHGFVALSLDYFPPDGVQNPPPYFELEYFEEAAEWLCKQPKVLPGGIGIHSICFGAWVGLLLASFRSDIIKATVAVSPTIFAYQAPFKHRGKVSGILPWERTKLLQTEYGIIGRHCFPYVTKDTSPDLRLSAITPCENISRPVLLIYGTSDLASNSDFCAKQVLERMKRTGTGHLCSILRYPNAGHLIEPPYSPHCYFSESQGFGLTVWGGETEAHSWAQEDAWLKIISFLKRNLSRIKCSL